MSTAVVVQSGDVRDVNNTCNVLHVPRSAPFTSSDVLAQISAIQEIIAKGVPLPANVNDAYGGQVGVTWLGDDGSDVLACQWAKDLDGVVGTISMQLKPRTRYLQTILPGDLLFVFMDDTGDYNADNRFAGTLVTVVVVDRVAEARTVQSNATVEVITVTARDLSVVLSESSTVFDQSFAQIENALYTGDFIGQLFGGKKQKALSPLENVLLLLLLLYDQDATGSKLADMQWKLTAGDSGASLTQLISLLDVTTFVQNPMPFYALAEPPGIIQAGNVWSLLESYSNPLINEFFIDVRDNNAQERDFRIAQSANARTAYFSDNATDPTNQNTTVNLVLNSALFRSNTTQDEGGSTVPGTPNGTSVVALVFRQRPYDADTFFALPFNTVESTEVDTMEVARSSHDVFNWFRLRFPNLDVKLQELVAGVRVVPQSIAKFGFRRMEAETRYMFASSAAATVFNQGNTKTDFGDVFRQYVDLLSKWYAQNEIFLAGTMVMRFNPRIRVGTRLLYTRGGEAFNYYVQGVQHSFQSTPGMSRTTLTITRGVDIVNATVPLVPTVDMRHDGFAINPGSQ